MSEPKCPNAGSCNHQPKMIEILPADVVIESDDFEDEVAFWEPL